MAVAVNINVEAAAMPRGEIRPGRADKSMKIIPRNLGLGIALRALYDLAVAINLLTIQPADDDVRQEAEAV